MSLYSMIFGLLETNTGKAVIAAQHLSKKREKDKKDKKSGME